MTHSEDGALFFYSSSLTSKPFFKCKEQGCCEQGNSILSVTASLRFMSVAFYNLSAPVL